MRTHETSTLQKVLHGMKGVSGYRINGLLQRRGRVWQREAFDHILRGNEGIVRTAQYIAENPVRGGPR